MKVYILTNGSFFNTVECVFLQEKDAYIMLESLNGLDGYKVEEHEVIL